MSEFNVQSKWFFFFLFKYKDKDLLGKNIENINLKGTRIFFIFFFDKRNKDLLNPQLLNFYLKQVELPRTVPTLRFRKNINLKF